MNDNSLLAEVIMKVEMCQTNLEAMACTDRPMILKSYKVYTTLTKVTSMGNYCSIMIHLSYSTKSRCRYAIKRGCYICIELDNS